MIPEAAVEAARSQIPDGAWLYGATVRKMLEAAAHHMLTDSRGEGDYLPGWDNRKTLAHIWQCHTPLPAEGLSDAVYEALIAVAAWGYEQRRLEAA